jgi:hypothetical protein
MFGLAPPHAGEISLSAMPNLPADAAELARFWISSDRSFVAVARPREWPPELLGSMLIECLHTAASTYAEAGDMSEAEALERLWRGVDEERTRLGTPDSPEDLH